MREIKDAGQKPPKKPLIFYYLIALLVLFLLNALVFPSLMSPKVVEVSYNEFLNMIDEGQVKQVALEESSGQLVFLADVSEEGAETAADSGQYGIFKTGIWPDDGQRLLEQLRSDPDIQFTAEIPTQSNPLLSFIMTWILPVFFFILIGELLSRWMMKRMNKQMGGGFGNAMSFGKSGAKVYVEETETGVTFADVAGQEEAKESLKELVDFLHEPEKYAKIGAKLPKGALLVGPPGTGKTLLAKAVAGEAKVPFFSISGSEFVEMFVGMGAAKVRDLFKQANEKAPCIVFIDEIDAIGKKRDAGGLSGNDEREQTLNQLLAEMDGFDARRGVVMLAATNRPESLDSALLRPGRFDRRIPVELPDLAGRIAILKVHAKDVKLGDDVNWDLIARATAGASGAELANIVNEAALRAVRQGRNVVMQEDLEESVETVIAGAQRKNAVVSTSEKKIVSYHEIGHALVAAMQSHSAPVTKITIVPRTSGALGYTMQVDEGEKMLMSRTEIYNKIATLTGGRSAEELIFGKENMTTGASNDIEQATKLARAMITRYGMSDEFDMTAMETVQNQYLGGDTSLTCAPETASKVDAMVTQIIKEAHEKAMKILKENEGKLHELAAYLLEKETITGEEFMKILERSEGQTRE
ncbi:MAG TPA: ATP-dependent zinc metalloprotease FtsH [Candidatus Fimimorpha excrementavium]|nr:ATP-dependent zinc metalloprotease FtsH [Candidatus Fimimorpha excrementavium]